MCDAIHIEATSVMYFRDFLYLKVSSYVNGHKWSESGTCMRFDVKPIFPLIWLISLTFRTQKTYEQVNEMSVCWALKAYSCRKLPHHTQRFFLCMWANASTPGYVNTPSYSYVNILCKAAVQDLQCGPTCPPVLLCRYLYSG